MDTFSGIAVPADLPDPVRRAFNLLNDFMRGKLGLYAESPGGRRFRFMGRDDQGDAFLDLQALTGEGVSGTPEWKILGSLYLGTEVWHAIGGVSEPAFENGWGNFAAPYGPARFRKDPWGYVHLEGTVYNGAPGDSAFTLPVGFRPAYTMEVPAGGTGAAYTWVQLDAAGGFYPGDGTQTGFNVIFKAEG